MNWKNSLEAQIVSFLQMQESGRSGKEICREHVISNATFNNWKAKYGGIDYNEERLHEALGNVVQK